ncbi:protein kinase [Streptomyces varsoviensis]|nr:protein kinase [Streptomyces varsoviensis]
MDDYAGRVLADRYRLPLPPSDEFELVETRAFDSYSGQEVLLRQIPLPEVVEAEVVGEEGRRHGPAAGPGSGRVTQGAGDPAVRRALDAAGAAAQVPDHPRLDQVFHVFAEAGSLWIVSELIPARPLAALLAERTLTPHRAAEVAADVLTALRALHAHGWTHRNITARTVLVCDDGRAVLTGLAAGAAEEALCGYDPVPDESAGGGGPSPRPAVPAGSVGGGNGGNAGPGGFAAGRPVGPPVGGRAAIATARAADGGSGPRPPAPARNGSPPQAATGPAYRDQGAAGGFLPQAAAHPGTAEPPRNGAAGPDPRAVRAGAIAAYRAGTRAAAARTDAEGPNGPAHAPGAPAPAPGAPSHAPGGNPHGPGGAPHGPGGTATWGGGSAASGTAPTGPAPNSAAWNADALVKTGLQSPVRRTAGSAGAAGGAAGEGAGALTSSGSPMAGGSTGREGASGAAGGAGASGSAEAPVTSGGGHARTDSTEPWGHSGGDDQQGRGPRTALDAERARQARMVVVGPVTERWAPEQAGPVHENWRLAPPVGPAADLWALGALLFRAVQGHAPYPEETAAELVQLVCAEPPAYAEECGALRPVVESLMRKDPTERPDFEELRGWLRSLIRSAPEPELGSRTVTVPSIGPGAPSDPRRLPIKRRRGELVRRRRSGASSAAPHGRHKKAHKAPHRTVTKQPRPPRSQRLTMEHSERPAPAARPERTGRPGHERQGRAPRRLGRLLLLLILLALAGAIAYALLFMPRQEKTAGQVRTDRTGAAGAQSAAPDGTGAKSAPRSSAAASMGEQEPQTSEPAGVAKGFTLRQDPKGFAVSVAKDWQRRGENARGQVVYIGGDYELIVVPGRDKVSEYGADPMAYQQDKEPELAPYRSSSWSGASGLRRIDVGRTAMAEGTFNWNDSSGRQVYVRNAAMILEGRYHLLQVIGPANDQRAVDRFYDQATATYRAEA